MTEKIFNGLFTDWLDPLFFYSPLRKLYGLRDDAHHALEFQRVLEAIHRREQAPEPAYGRFEEMASGVHDEGVCVLRTKVDMASFNMNLRDSVIYRVKKASPPQDRHRLEYSACFLSKPRVRPPRRIFEKFFWNKGAFTPKCRVTRCLDTYARCPERPA